MPRSYLEYVKDTAGAKRAALICKELLIPLYQGAGFKLVGKSAIVHGQDPWFDMIMQLEEA
jgi:hypothetical protein